MDSFKNVFSRVLKFLMDHGWIVGASTAIGGLMLGPEGLLLGSVAGGAGATVSTVMESAGWSRLVRSVTSFILTILPHVSIDYILELINGVARLFVKLMRRLGFLEASEVQNAITYHPQPGAPS